MTDDAEKTIAAGDVYSEKTSYVGQPGAEPTQMAVGIECPVCHTSNPPAETYCMDCGFLLTSQPEEQGVELEMRPPAVLVTTDGTREFALHVGQNTVGRQDADVLLTHNTVSRKHAVITVEDSKVYVEDIGSTNGTYVGGSKLNPGQKVELTDGAEIVFGNQTLILKLTTPSEEPSTKEETVTAQEAPVECVEIAPEPETQEAEAVAKLISEDGTVSHTLTRRTYSIGRREGNDIVIPDPYCSGRHAELRIEEDRMEIVDLNSTNGTLVNGVRIEPNNPYEIRIGDQLTFGQTVLKLEAPQ
ncbi:MAG: FHA domain-containing protein [Armatimonadota bacterium]|nr:FHA domain-containing protein [Armatimonadota bacterium]